MKNNTENLEYVVIDYIKDDNILLSIDKFLLSSRGDAPPPLRTSSAALACESL